jgi:rare lipoprotein A
MARWAAGCVVLALATGCGGGPAPRSAKDEATVLTGKATWYSDKLDGRTTASGAKYDKHKLTAAHLTLPFGTKVKVTNLSNGKSVVVTINDRGPFGKKERIIDLSRAAAEKIGMIEAGVVDVTVEILH